MVLILKKVGTIIVIFQFVGIIGSNSFRRCCAYKAWLSFFKRLPRLINTFMIQSIIAILRYFPMDQTLSISNTYEPFKGSFSMTPVHLRAFSLLTNMYGKRILDLGCGNGEFSVLAIQAGASVTGIDFEQSVLDVARKASPAGIFLQGNVTDINFPAGSFDACILLGIVGHLPDSDVIRVFRVCFDALPSGGEVIIRVGTKRNKLSNIVLKLLHKSYKTRDHCRSSLWYRRNLQNSGFNVERVIVSADYLSSQSWLRNIIRLILEPVVGAHWYVCRKK